MGPRLRMDRLNLCVLIVLPSSGIGTAVYRMLPFTPYAAVYLCIGVVCVIGAVTTVLETIVKYV